MTFKEHVLYKTMKLLLFISKILGWLPKLLFNILILPSWLFRRLAMLCVPKQVKKKLISHRLNKQRNLKCRCGSGRKYKNCHWKEDVAKVE